MTSHAGCFLFLFFDLELLLCIRNFTCVLGSEIEPLSHSRDGSSWNWTSHCCVECWQSDERM